MILSLHGLRGIMALTILVHHLAPFAFAGNVLPIELNLHHAVDIFFVLSGYVLALSYQRKLPFDWAGFLGFVRSRVIRIVPVAWMFVASMFIAHGLIAWSGSRMNHPLDTSLANFVANLLFLDSNLPWFESAGPKWSVSNEMVAYLFLFPLAPLARKVPLVSILLCALLPIVLWQPLSELGTLFSRCIPGFFAGVSLFFLLERLATRPIALVVWKASVLTGLALFFVAPNSFQVVAALLVIAGVLGLPSLETISRSHPIFAWLGDISYPLYLTHAWYVLLVAGILAKIPFLRATFPLWGILVAVLAVVTAHLVHHRFERPVGHWLKARWAKS